MTTIPYKLHLDEQEMPRQWHNLRAFMKEQPHPMLNPATLQPVSVEDLSHVFCQELSEQEMNSSDKYIDIPQ